MIWNIWLLRVVAAAVVGSLVVVAAVKLQPDQHRSHPDQQSRLRSVLVARVLPAPPFGVGRVERLRLVRLHPRSVVVAAVRTPRIFPVLLVPQVVAGQASLAVRLAEVQQQVLQAAMVRKAATYPKAVAAAVLVRWGQTEITPHPQEATAVLV